MCRGQAQEGSVEVVANDGDVVWLASATHSVLDAALGGPLAEIRDVGAGHARCHAGQLGGQPVWRVRWRQLEPSQVVLEYLGSATFVGQAHPCNLVNRSSFGELRSVRGDLCVFHRLTGPSLDNEVGV